MPSAILFLAVLALPGSARLPDPAPRAAELVFDDAFWKHWGDGQAELAGYRLTTPRYGAPRTGVAVTIFVSETFSDSARVKADPGKHPARDEFPVLKLNLVEDFATGIYDYNLMSSCFVALTKRHGRPAGSPTKLSFSAQEWCGHAYSQVRFEEDELRYASHSYFDGEGDEDGTVDAPADLGAEDALFHWARGLAAPALAPGETRSGRLLNSLRVVRLGHRPLAQETVRYTRAAAPERTSVPAGEFEAERLEATLGSGRRWTFLVERAAPRRILSWETSEGERAELLGSTRAAYWKQNGPGFEAELAKLGLKPRGERMP